MNYLIKHKTILNNNRWIFGGIFLFLVAVCVIGLSSQIIGGGFMRPIGDDYKALFLFHDSAQHWLINTMNYLAHENGRYSQNITFAVSYGILGHKLLYITSALAILSMLAAYFFFLPAILPSIKDGVALRLGASLVLCFSL